jgi:hypothetical protein
MNPGFLQSPSDPQLFVRLQRGPGHLFPITKSRIAEENSAAAFVVGDNRVPNSRGDLVRNLLDGTILGHGSL